MSQSTPLPYPPRPTTNGLAIVGFILSILGFFTGLILCPVGMILCFFALFRRPRGLAFAGMCIGLFGTAILAAIVYVFGFIIFTCFTMGAPGFKTAVAAHEAQEAVKQFAQRNGRLPENLEGQMAISGKIAGWGRQLRYARIGPSAEIRSAGKNGILNDDDDLEMRYP